MEAPPQLSGLAELANLDPAGKPPSPSRLTSPEVLRAIHQQNLQDDEHLATDRARVQAMADGEPPYSQAALNATGQGARANANFLEGRNRINRANNGYLDIITSVKHLMTLSVEYGEPSQRFAIARTLAEELTRTIRQWPQWIFRFKHLVDLFNTHGVGIAYWPNPADFRFSSCGLGDFLIPRQTPASEDAIEIATARKDMTVQELYSMISDPATAEATGWNVDAVNAAIRRATTTSSMGQAYEIERTQREIKSGDLIANKKYQHVKILCGWVREFDGSYTYAMVEKDAPNGKFLCFQPHKYKSANDAFALYTYGVGNGTYHGIRGMGHMIYPIVQLLNRTRCTGVDTATVGSSILLESESASALEDMRIVNIGPYSVLPKGFSAVKDRTMPNLTNSIVPVLNDARGLLDENSSQFFTPSQSGVYQNKDAIDSQLEAVASGSSGAVDLFYSTHDRVMRQMVFRIVNGPKSDPLVKEFHRRIAAKGITRAMLDSIDHASTYAFRAVGAGSPAARSCQTNRILTILPQLDEIGRKRAVFQIVSDIYGSQNADYYATEPEEPRLPIDAKVAELENHHLLSGAKVKVNPQELHGAHVNEHIPAIMEVLDGVERGEIDPMQQLPGLQAMLEHISVHGDELANDPTQEPAYRAVKEVVNNMSQVVTNMERKIKAEQRQQAESGQQGQAGPQADQAVAELKMAQEQFKLELMQRKGELELAALQAKANQMLALNDLKAAEQVQRKLAYPRTEYQARR